jgi:toxoflavin synthase
MASSHDSTTKPGPPAAQYDALAPAYDLVWSAPAVRPLLPLLTRVLKSTGIAYKDASVLDLACGTGIGLRLLQSLGASNLVGVDISAEMVDIAKSTFGPTEPGQAEVLLHVADCSKPLDTLGLQGLEKEQEGTYDVVLGFWLLNYAPSAKDLRGMWENVAKYLKKGAKFVGVVESHDVALPRSIDAAAEGGAKYGVTMSEVKDLPNGEGWSLHVAFDTTPRIEFDAWRMYKDVFEREAKGAGFEKVKYHQPGWEDVRECIAQGIGGEEGKDEKWWTELVEHPPNYVIVTQKD